MLYVFRYVVQRESYINIYFGYIENWIYCLYWKVSIIRKKKSFTQYMSFAIPGKYSAGCWVNCILETAQRNCKKSFAIFHCRDISWGSLLWKALTEELIQKFGEYSSYFKTSSYAVLPTSTIWLYSGIKDSLIFTCHGFHSLERTFLWHFWENVLQVCETQIQWHFLITSFENTFSKGQKEFILETKLWRYIS